MTDHHTPDRLAQFVLDARELGMNAQDSVWLCIQRRFAILGVELATANAKVAALEERCKQLTELHQRVENLRDYVFEMHDATVKRATRLDNQVAALEHAKGDDEAPVLNFYGRTTVAMRG